jgi:hypothetical protein
MKLLHRTTVTMALFGAGTCLADEPPNTQAELAVDPGERQELVLGDVRPEGSELLLHIEAATAWLRSGRSVTPGSLSADTVEIQTIDVSAANAGGIEAGTQVASTTLCKHMAPPGSTIKRQRCFYETPGEAALNDFQFRAEIEQMLEQNARDFMEVAEYGDRYRRSLMDVQIR